MATEQSMAIGITPQLLERYLTSRGWESQGLSGGTHRLWVDEDNVVVPIEVFLSYGRKTETRDVRLALTTVSQYYERTFEEISAEIRSLAYDTITSRIPDAYILNDTIELRIASEYLDKMKELLAAGASAEVSGDRYVRRLRKEGIDYSERCRFGHTFRGSFGFQIESPVGLNDEPTLDGMEKTPPLGRRVVQRISRGLSSLRAAEIQGSSLAIVSDPGGFSSNMCDVMVDIIKDVGISHLEIDIAFSPEWRPIPVSEPGSFYVSHAHAEILEEAAKALRVEEPAQEVEIAGRIKRLETDGNPSDIFEDTSRREIELVWVNDEGRPIQVKLLLSPEQYLLALDAHREGRLVLTRGTLKRVGRSWRLEELVRFDVIGG